MENKIKGKGYLGVLVLAGIVLAFGNLYELNKGDRDIEFNKIPVAYF